MNTWTRVGLTVAGVTALAMLMGTGYLAKTGFSQLYAPAEANAPGKAASGNNVAKSGNRAANDAESEKRPARDPIPDGESVWEDYALDDLDYTQRLPERPGNFEVIRKVGEFFESSYQVRPTMKDVAYPFFQDSKRTESSEAAAEADREWEAGQRASGTKKKNKLRQYNLIIHRMTMVRFATGEFALTNPKELGVDEKKIERFAQVRKAHSERCYLVLLRVGWESLQSAKVEGDRSDSDMILCYVQKLDGWKLVWFEK